MSILIRKITNRWSKSGVIETSEKDVYEYGLELILFSLLNLAIIFATAAVFGRVPESIALMLAIVPMQAYGGGYHAKTHFRCFLIMYIGWWATMHAVLPIFEAFAATATGIAAILIIFAVAPVSHVNVGMSSEHRLRLRFFVRMAALTVFLAAATLTWLIAGGTRFGITLFVGLGIAAFSMLIAHTKNLIKPRVQMR
ncbi:MAG: accessory gene regulator B family protein [Oscillospiraceae bacterium]|nr:accessory gene regulator B family protein [Oscillospiraceae bacterium]